MCDLDGGPNCISAWFPRLERAGVPVPKTRILEVPEDMRDLWNLLDGKPSRGAAWLQAQIMAVAPDLGGYPMFLRTGHTSAKHEWADTCCLCGDAEIVPHIFRIVEYSEMVSFIGLPIGVWAVREMLPTAPAFYAFDGRMPIVREFRFFIRDGAIEHVQPYWPPSSIRYPSEADWLSRLRGMSVLREVDRFIIDPILAAVCAEFHEYWSVDLLQTADAARPWVVTDMARGDDSFRWDGDFEVDAAKVG